MKHFLLVVALVWGLGAQAQIRKAELQASGLTCSMCSNAINKALKTLDFVEKVETDLNKNLFIITFQENKSVSFDQLRDKVTGAGFSVARLWVFADFENQAVKKDDHISYAGMTIHFLNNPAATLQGTQKLQVVDPTFVLGKEEKKYGSMTKMACYKTGKMESCCQKPEAEGGQRVYHVII